MNLKKMLQEVTTNDPVMKERFKNAALVSGVEGYGLPLASKRRVLSGERYMLTGDAAYLIDPFAGEGIGNALVFRPYSGATGRRLFESKMISRPILCKAYDNEVYRVLGPELRLSTKLQRLANKTWLFNFF